MRILFTLCFSLLTLSGESQLANIIDCSREENVKECILSDSQNLGDSAIKIIGDYFDINKLSFIDWKLPSYQLHTTQDSIFYLLLESEYLIKSAEIDEDKAFLNYKRALLLAKKSDQSLQSEVLRSINNYLNFSTQDMELYEYYIGEYIAQCDSQLDCAWAEFCRIKYSIRSQRASKKDPLISNSEWSNLIATCIENDYKYLLLDVYCSYGSYLSNKQDQYENSILTNAKGLSLSQEIGDHIYDQNKFLLIANSSNVRMRQGKYQEALLGFNAIPQAEIDRQRIDNQSMFYNWKSICYEETGQVDSALYYVKLSKKKKSESNNLAFDTSIRKIEETFKNRELSQDLEQQKVYNYILGFGLLVLFGVGYLIYNSFKLKRKILDEKLNRTEAELKINTLTALSEERTRIASEMHDDLGGGLTTIKFLSQKVLRKTEDDIVKTQVKKIVNQSETLVNNMSEIIWAMNSGFDTLSSLISYSRRYAHEYLDTHDIAIAFKVEGAVSNIKVSGTERRNIFLVIKECLHNAVKHAQCSQVSILYDVGEDLVVTIKDDGVGITESNDLGNGLQNMKQRMERIGGEFYHKNNNGLQIILKYPNLTTEKDEKIRID